ncbi:hypothetical protein PCC7424_5472 (plasmid) [Gloeothece citriformis PCC 7424]|uniref:Uncharacterized protein n=1 Tax=Gloeothece citriformis (strain PCC 7424) TaxID=65393 RepID=B7KMM1_GLOC7|nr:hypothetical protein PCC7424_5472 [Gloeothece citriformis PCC 7424]
MKKLIGLSFSLYIPDIWLGKVSESQVKKLVTSTCYHNDEELTELIEEYRHAL